MAVRVHKAGIDLQPRRVDRLFRVQVGADLQELPVFDQDIGRVRLAVYRVVDAAVFDTKHIMFLPFRPDPAFLPSSIADAAARRQEKPRRAQKTGGRKPASGCFETWIADQ